MSLAKNCLLHFSVGVFLLLFRSNQKEKTSIPLMDYVLNVVCCISAMCLLHFTIVTLAFVNCEQWYKIIIILSVQI